MIKKGFMATRALIMTLLIGLLLFSVGCDGSANNNTENSGTEMSISEMYNTENSGTEMSISEMYSIIGTDENYPYELSAKSKQFMNEHEDCFPTTNYSHISRYIDTSIEYRQISKNPANFGDKLIEVSELYIIGIEEQNISEEDKFSIIQAFDIDENVYYILYNGSIDVYNDDIVKAVLLPLDMMSYENVSGGTTIALAAAGSYIEKIEE